MKTFKEEFTNCSFTDLLMKIQNNVNKCSANYICLKELLTGNFCQKKECENKNCINDCIDSLLNNRSKHTL